MAECVKEITLVIQDSGVKRVAHPLCGVRAGGLRKVAPMTLQLSRSVIASLNNLSAV